MNESSGIATNNEKFNNHPRQSIHQSIDRMDKQIVVLEVVFVSIPLCGCPAALLWGKHVPDSVGTGNIFATGCSEWRGKWPHYPCGRFTGQPTLKFI